MTELDDPSRIEQLKDRIAKKPALRKLYEEVYRRFRKSVDACPEEGVALEIGSGGGFVKEIVPEMVTSDVIAYEGIDLVVDATRMPFDDGELRAICMLNVFHHIDDVGAFLREVQRCLRPGGRLLLVDQYPGWLSTPIYKYLHHEPFDPAAETWRFDSTGPLSAANGALAWIVFERDRALFEERFQSLQIVRYAPHTPLRYWMSGGLKAWSLLPGWGFSIASRLDGLLATLSPRMASFADVEVVRRD